jgi:hypothetical protein
VNPLDICALSRSFSSTRNWLAISVMRSVDHIPTGKFDGLAQVDIRGLGLLIEIRLQLLVHEGAVSILWLPLMGTNREQFTA